MDDNMTEAEWGKLLMIIMAKYDLVHVIITPEDIESAGKKYEEVTIRPSPTPGNVLVDLHARSNGGGFVQ